MHRYWARRPLAACRAVIFASLVDDPSTYLDEPEAQRERERLHDIIRRLVVWQNSNAENLLAEARYEIAKSVARSHGDTAPKAPDAVLRYLAEKAPAVYDPFCGGGSIPLEAQRLGLRARASDLNPIAVLINKAMIELPHPFRNQSPINPDADPMGMFIGTGSRKEQVPWRGTAGLANDIRHYGKWMREEAYQRIGHLYPKVKLQDGTEATVIAWLWARTVPCPNRVCHVPMPLINTFELSTKKGNKHWTRPIVSQVSKTLSFIVQNHDTDVPKKGTVGRNGAVCIGCGTPVELEYIREHGRNGRIEVEMTAIVAEGERGRLFLSPTDAHIQIAHSATPNWLPRGSMPEQSLGIGVQNYGLTQWYHLFTVRQLTALTTFSDLLSEVQKRILEDGASTEYTNVLCSFLSFAIGRTAESGSNLTTWMKGGEKVPSLFGRQAIGIVWDFAEANPFSSSTQNWIGQIERVATVVERLPTTPNAAQVYQADAAATPHAADSPIIVTDPPYYDNIAYADISDFFYVWLRKPLRGIYPDLFAGMSTPKAEEMIANRHRFENSRDRFEKLLNQTLQRIRERCSDEYPTSIFYAYKQQEEGKGDRASTGWETMLNAVTSSGFQIVGTWPMRTELTSGLKPRRNMLASSIVLVCRPRPDSAPNISVGGFLSALRSEMPIALDRLTREAHIAPVDLAQAAIGPGMEIYSRYKSIKTRRDGELVDMSVREALVAINNEIDRYHEEQEGEFDSDTRFCLTWFRQYGFTAGDYGEADVLAKAQDVTIAAMQGRILTAERGKVHLLPLNAYDGSHPNAGLSLLQLTTWEACHLMVYHLNPNNAEGRDVEGAAEIGRALRDNPTSGGVESIEQLARILYSHYDQQGNSANAVLFNNLVTAWDAIEERMREAAQSELSLDME